MIRGFDIGGAAGAGACTGTAAFAFHIRVGVRGGDEAAAEGVAGEVVDAEGEGPPGGGAGADDGEADFGGGGVGVADEGV